VRNGSYFHAVATFDESTELRVRQVDFKHDSLSTLLMDRLFDVSSSPFIAGLILLNSVGLKNTALIILN
jgi:hypothetical protein